VAVVDLWVPLFFLRLIFLGTLKREAVRLDGSLLFLLPSFTAFIVPEQREELDTERKINVVDNQ
jgi:hypothetical protein